MTDAANRICEAFGIDPATLPGVAGSCRGPALVVGSGRCVWAGFRHGSARPVVAVNDIGCHWPGIVDHWYSNDGLMLRCWDRARRPEWRDRENPKLHTCGKSLPGIAGWPWPGHGSSGLGAVYTALALGYDDILLAGIPLDGDGHYFDPPGVGGAHYEAELRYWRNAKERGLLDSVRSLSGNTRELLGGPDDIARAA